MPAKTPESPITLTRRFLDRELGNIAFNERVFSLAQDPGTPLLERLRYLTIVSSNLDELFEVRVAELYERLEVAEDDRQSLADHIERINQRVDALVQAQYDLLNDHLLPSLAEEGIRLLAPDMLDEAQLGWALEYFSTQIEPILTPIALDPAHPFPKLLNKSLAFIIELEGIDSFGRPTSLAVLPAPRALPRILRIPQAIARAPNELISLSQVIRVGIDRLFPGLTVRSINQFRITRNSELFIDDEEITNLRIALQGELRQRHFGDAVRLEASAGCPAHLIDKLLTEFQLPAHACFLVNGPVNLSRFSQVVDLVDRPDLKFPVFEAAAAPWLRSGDIFAAIRARDILLHHPYDSFSTVMKFLETAVQDPDVVAIKQTVYRTGADSALMELLLTAARAGKEVTVIVELFARFDEETNINWAARLEAAGAHVVYGVVGHKTHAKMLLVVRRENGLLQRYVHLGTGNYHPRTARLYEDFGMFSAREDLCTDVQEVFRRLTGVDRSQSLRVLWQSPLSMHRGILDSIRREAEFAKAGRRAYIVAKVNALLEHQVIEALYEASQAGVKIDLIVRGVCALRPGVPGLSENIRVRSVLGRFLEHSRVYYFHHDGQKDVWLSSADWMGRNLHRRVEVAFPVRVTSLKNRVIREALTIHLRDNANAWVMDSEGVYRRKKTRSGQSSQQRLLASSARVKPPH
jgi:polyphosphate kinase